MIYFTSYRPRPHPCLMSSALEYRLIPVGRNRFIETHFNIRQQVCCPHPQPRTQGVRSGLLIGNIITIKPDWDFKLLWCLNWNTIKLSTPVFVRNFSKHKVSLGMFLRWSCVSPVRLWRSDAKILFGSWFCSIKLRLLATATGISIIAGRIGFFLSSQLSFTPTVTYKTGLTLLDIPRSRNWLKLYHYVEIWTIERVLNDKWEERH